jgi:hypothetical protein
MKVKFSLLVLVCVAISQCVSPPDYPIEPRLSLGSRILSKTTVLSDIGTSSRDSVLITVEFTDGDGDIGFTKSDSSLFIIDTRDKSRINDARGLLYVPEQGAGNGISGEISMVVYGGCCRGIAPCSFQNDRARDTVTYEIYIKDRAGHESNRVKTPPISIICK